MASPSASRLRARCDELRLRLAEAEQALEAIRTGQVDSLVVEGPGGPRVFSLDSTAHAYRALVEAMSEGAATVDARGTILYCNGAFAALLGAPLERVMGTALGAWIAERLRPSAEEMARDAAAGPVREEVALARPTGEEVPAILSVSAVPGEGVLCAVLTDLREQKRAEEQRRREEALRESEERHRRAAEALLEADRQKNDFLALLSHELRNPLAPIQHSLYILERAAPGGEQARRVQGILKRQVRQLTRLVDDLLDLTRLSRNKLHLKLEAIELTELVRRAAEDHRPLFEANGVSLDVELPPEPLPVRADGPRVAQVIGNLLQNAAKFTPRGGRTRLSVARDGGGDRALVRVADTGVGLAPELLDRIFEPFLQARATLERSRGGLGLGLALVRSLVEMHGGDVTARSDGPGRGAEFLVRLPLEEVAPASPRRAAGRGAHQPRRVLVIDDNADAAESVRDLLELAGHAVTVAHDAREGIALARRTAPEVVLCDVGLPDMDGYEVARTLRADPALSGALLVALSGYARAEDVARARRAGFDRHVAKPADADALDEALGAPERDAGASHGAP